MTGNNHRSPSIFSLARKTLITGFGALQNRGELFAVELQEEKSRLINLVIAGLGALFLGVMAALLLTGTIIFLSPEEDRVYVAGAFTGLYLIGALAAAFYLKAALKRAPFSESLNQLKKDRELLEAFK